MIAIPLNDTEPNRYSTFPFVTVIIIFLCTAIQIIQSALVGNDGYEFAMKYGIVPGLVMGGVGGGMLSNITSMFLHVGWYHLIGNMVSLWVFGRRVEDACGSWRFLAFYLMAGTGANILYTLFQYYYGHYPMIPGVGASGAIMGVMGAYLLLYPSGRIRTFILLVWVPLWPKLRAWVVVLFFIIYSIAPAVLLLIEDQPGGVNYWAHLGGFLSSVLILLFLRPGAYARYASDTLV